MSCNSNCYLPIPPRAWSRVQNSCSLFDENTYSGDALVPLPYSGRLVPASTLYLEYAMLNKGNVLQYKKNSSNLTKQQRYAQIAKGKWVNRNTTWATQSTRGYTNPNNQSLQRVNSVNITLDGQPTLAPVTCPTPFTPVYEPLPGTSSSGANPEVIPPPPPPPTFDSGTELPPTIIEIPILPIVIQDLGNLICGTQENVCTGEIIRQLVADNCHPTSDSDVPGPLMELCWNDGNPTWFPRQRYVMTNSGNKWPDNYKLLVSAISIPPPVITSISNIENVVTLTWTQDESCLPVNDFTIYEDGIPVKIVSGTTFTTSIVVDNCATYTFYIAGSNGSIVSDPSNSISIDIFLPLPPTILSATKTQIAYEIYITWINNIDTCNIPTSYNIYYINNNNISDNGVVNVSGNLTSYTLTVLNINTNYTIQMTSLNLTDESSKSNIVICVLPNFYTTTLTNNLSGKLGSYYYISFSTTGGPTNITFNYNLNNSQVLCVAGGGGGSYGYNTGSTFGGLLGPGGGGGGSGILSLTIFENTVYSMTIGNKGMGGSGFAGTNGGSTSLSSLITCTGGNGGSTEPSVPGAGGICDIISGNGGSGGNNNNGQNSTIILTIPIDLQTVFNNLYGGGGGSGGGDSNTNGTGGSPGLNGSGGAKGVNNSGPSAGNSASIISYGSGGGGGGSTTTPDQFISGGNGAPGYIAFWWTI